MIVLVLMNTAGRGGTLEGAVINSNYFLIWLKLEILKFILKPSFSITPGKLRLSVCVEFMFCIRLMSDVVDEKIRAMAMNEALEIFAKESVGINSKLHGKTLGIITACLACKTTCNI